jgi:hypothetical protein
MKQHGEPIEVKAKFPAINLIATIFLVTIFSIHVPVVACISEKAKFFSAVFYPMLLAAGIGRMIFQARSNSFLISSAGIQNQRNEIVEWPSIKAIVPRRFLRSGVEILLKNGKKIHLSSRSKGYSEAIERIKAEVGPLEKTSKSAHEFLNKDGLVLALLILICSLHTIRISYFLINRRDELMAQVTARGCQVSQKILWFLGANATI